MKNNEYKIKLANLIVEIESPNNYLKDKCRDYFLYSEQTDIYIEKITAKEIQEEREIAARQRAKDNLPQIDFCDDYLEYINTYRKIVEKSPSFGVFLMHGAAVAVEDKAYMFLAKSGTGKTTHILNWVKAVPGTVIINGDKPLIDTRNMAVCGTPWSGKENYNTNITIPLAGICVLERGSTNNISRVSSWDAVRSINNQTYWPSDVEMRRKTLKMVDKLSEIPCYKLACTPEEESAKISYSAMRK